MYGNIKPVTEPTYSYENILTDVSKRVRQLLG